MKWKILQILFAMFACALAHAQVSSGSNGSDGAFNPAYDTTINMADHPNGIYQYTSVNIPSGVTVSFIPNANNTPVTWLVQSTVVINGTVNVAGQFGNQSVGGVGGPGGWSGGNGGSNPTPGQGPGGGPSETGNNFGSGGSYGTLGGNSLGPVYGNSFLLPLLGGSGGGGVGDGVYGSSGGGGGGGAILIAASNSITVNGQVTAAGGAANGEAGSGSGGGIRLVTVTFSGTGGLNTTAGVGPYAGLGKGRVRIDAFQNSFGGNFDGVLSQGFQPIIIPGAGQGIQLNITSVGGTAISTSPTGQLVTPDAVISGQQANPIPVVVICSNLPLNTAITVTIAPVNGSSVSAVGYNTSGTLASSTATISIIIPRGGGLIYATAATGN